MNTHSCGARWTGMQAAHCCECHLTFSSDWAWEQHRTGTTDAEGRRHCRDPLEADLIAIEKPWGTCWTTRGRDGRWVEEAGVPIAPATVDATAANSPSDVSLRGSSDLASSSGRGVAS